jgi:hypothetical protein
MPQYRVLAAIYLQAEGTAGAHQYRPGDLVRFAGEPSPSLQPLDADAKAAMATALHAKDTRRTHPTDSTRPIKWARALGAGAVTSMDDARSKITEFIREHHPDPAVRNGVQLEPRNFADGSFTYRI